MAEHLPTVWVAVRASLRQVLDETSLADVLSGDLPDRVLELCLRPGRLAQPLSGRSAPWSGAVPRIWHNGPLYPSGAEQCSAGPDAYTEPRHPA